MLTENFLLVVIVGSFVAAASAYIGSIMVLKRMALVGDALSHVALPGMAIALTLNINPILGAFTALSIAIVGIWYLEKNSETYPEALVGVFFTASLALGVLISEEHELLEALFGSIEKLNFIEGMITIALSVIVMAVTFYLSKKLVVMIISEDLAVTSGINVGRVNLIYLLLVGLIVSLGIRFVGTLLMGALVIIPAVSARNITRSMGGYFLTSVILGVISALAGITFAFYYGLPVGAVVVLASITIYIFSLFLRKLTVTN